MPHPDSHNILSSKGRNCPATLCGATAFSSEGGADLRIEDSQDPGKGSSFFHSLGPKANRAPTNFGPFTDLDWHGSTQ